MPKKKPVSKKKALDREAVRRMQRCLNIVNAKRHPDETPLSLNGILGEEMKRRLQRYMEENSQTLVENDDLRSRNKVG